jgi:hypothetical protein
MLTAVLSAAKTRAVRVIVEPIVRHARLNLLVAIAVGAVLGIGPALAADLPAAVYTKAPAAIPVTGWTGCYLGGNIGAGWQRTAVTDAEPGTPPPLDAGADTGTGVAGGGQLGCDYQFASSWWSASRACSTAPASMATISPRWPMPATPAKAFRAAPTGSAR